MCIYKSANPKFNLGKTKDINKSKLIPFAIRHYLHYRRADRCVNERKVINE